MGKESFIIYKSFYKPISKLSDKQLGRLFRAIFEYNISGVVSVEDDIEMAFEFFKNQFDIDENKYQGIVKRNQENGRRGGIQGGQKGNNPSNPVGATGGDRYPSNPVGAYNDNDNVNVNVNDNVSLFMRENNITHKERENFLYHLLVKRNLLNPAAELERFINHYSKTGWRDKNGNDIVDRLSALKAWQIDPSATILDPAQVNLWMSIVLVLVPPEKDKTAFLGDFRGLEKENDKLIIYCTETLKNTIENALNRENIQQLNKLGIKTINYRLKKEK